jgi:DNA-binding beta-propeller fold protein YncE
LAHVDSFIRAAILLALAAPPQSDSEKNYPNVLAPIYEFGRRGSDPGFLRHPAGLAVGKDDLLYVADAGNHRVQTFAMNGMPKGSFGLCGRGPGEFLFPSAVAVAPGGDVYVADAGGRLQQFSAEGRFLKGWEGFRSPRAVAVAADRVYVSEADTHQLRVLWLKDGMLRTLGAPGSRPGQFLSPSGVALDEDGQVYVADSGNHRIQKLDADGRPLAQWGAWGAQAGLLSFPAGLAYSSGRLTVADWGNHRVQVFDRSGALLRQWGAPPPRAGLSAGRLHMPGAVAVSPSGGLTVVGEPVDDRIQVFVNRDLAHGDRVNDLPWWDSVHARLHTVRLAPPPPGCKPQMAGALAGADVHAVFFFDVSSSALGPIATAGGFGRKLGEFNGVGGVAVDAERGRAWVSDRGNRRIVTIDLPRDAMRPELFGNRIRIVGSVAMERLIAAPPPGYRPEAAVPGPLALDGRGNLYLLDRANAAILVCDSDLKFIRLVPVTPTIQEFAVASDGTIYATDPPAFQVRVYDSEGALKSSWGRREEKAEDAFRMPYGVTVDDQGFVFVSDALQDVVKKFHCDGRFVKQWGSPGPRPDQFASPRGMAFVKPDRLLIEDFGNHRALMSSADGAWLGTYVAGGLATPLGIR